MAGRSRRGGDGRASGPWEREAQWVGRSRLRVRELIPPAALSRGALSVPVVVSVWVGVGCLVGRLLSSGSFLGGGPAAVALSAIR